MTNERPTLPPAAESLQSPRLTSQIARRGVLSAGAAISAAASLAGVTLLANAPAASASESDPIFVAIDAHRAANAAHLAAIHEANRLQELDRDFYWADMTEKPCHDENDAFEILLGAGATSIGGLLAKLEYLRSIADSEEAWMLDEREGAALLLIDSVTASLRNVGVLS